MPKPWLDLVTHRLLLKRVPVAQPGDGGNGSGRDGEELHFAHLAKWQQPEEGPVMRFVVTDGAIHLH